MTLQEIEDMPGEILLCTQVAPLLGSNPHTLRLCAKQRPELLGFPVIVMGTNVRIPKRPFLAFMRGETQKK